MSSEVMPGLIRRSNLVEMVHDAIEQAVRRGELAANGRQFTEAALCRKFNVSRPTVREALIRLRAGGALAVGGKETGAGSARFGQAAASPHYQPLSGIADLGRYFEFRLLVELGAVGLCASRRDASKLAPLHGAFDELRSHSHCRKSAAEADFLFHLALARASGNAVFASVMEALRAPALFAMNLSRQCTHEREQQRLQAEVDDEHRMIVDAIRRGDECAARTAMRSHVGKAAVRAFGASAREWQPANAAA